MKSIQLDQWGIQNLQLVDIPTPYPGENEVLVKTTATALEFHDLLVVENRIPFGIRLPYTPLTEGVGIVEKVGSRVTRWKKGDRVMIPFISRWASGKNTPYNDQLRTGFSAPGLLSEYTVQPENTLVATPHNLTDEEAAQLPITGLTAWAYLVDQANMQAGQTLLTQGTGGVSLFAIQLAKMTGLKVIATTGKPAKETKLKSLGADHTINYSNFPQWSDEAKRLNDGIGVDITLDVAGTDSIEQSILSVKQHGFVGLVGLLTGVQLSINMIPLITNYIRLQAYSVGNARQLADLARAVEANDLHPTIDSTFPIDRAQDAFNHFKSGNPFGKVIITV